MRVPMHSTVLSADKFHRQTLTLSTTMTASEFLALKEAAKAKGRLKEFLKWQQNRKIVLKG